MQSRTRTYAPIASILLLTLILTVVFPILGAPAAGKPKKTDPPAVKAETSFVYGKSGLGKNLICYKITPNAKIKGRILFTFEIHGFEDLYPKDGQVLVNIGNAVTEYFSQNTELLDGYELYVVPSANPDGLADGTTNNGKGRDQITLGVNINRDFPTNFITIYDERDHTLSKPLSAPESQALAKLVDSIKPAAVIDGHGWLDELIGDAGVASAFGPVGIKKSEDFDSGMHGFFSEWAATQGAKAVLMEYPPQATENTPFYIKTTEKGVENLTRMLSQGKK